jgi:enoyl-CoA hydratase
MENITTNLANGILTITINRPSKLNALNKATLLELKDVIFDVHHNKEIRAAIITGSGDKAFVAGADITEFLKYSKMEGKELARFGQGIFKEIEESPKPIVAAVNGYALGGGCELAMACHMRIASDNAIFAQPEIDLGIIPGYGGTQRLIQLIGKTKATELLLTADKISANQALDLGMVNYVVPQSELLNKCNELLGKIVLKSSNSVAKTLKCVNAYYNKLEDNFEREVKEFGKCFGTPDFIEGTTAFLEKRKPKFS